MNSLSYRLVNVPADAEAAAHVREQFTRWLRRHLDVGEVRLCDVILAVNEAVANVAEFAYLDGGGAGTFDLRADHDGVATLTIAICDQGRWRDTDPLVNARDRGRGIPLMRTLADAVMIDTSAQGTRVCLRFDRVGVGGRAAACIP